MPSRSAILLYTAGIILLGCLDPYYPPTSSEDVNFLVVDGFLNCSDSLLTVKLSRAIELDNGSSFPMVTSATVLVEDEVGNVTQVQQSNPGIYSIKKYFDPINKYRLKISTSGKEYVSEFIELKRTATIDSLSWMAFDDRLEIYASTHDFSSGFKYYRYTYDETYEYTSAFPSDYKLVGQSVQSRAENELIYSCWKTRPSNSVLLASTVGLSQNIISNNLILRFNKGDSRLWKKHSLLVKQTEISQEAYDYWTQIKKMSESLGGLFDPIPYAIKGNIISQSNPEEVVLGYFSGGRVDSKRIVIRFDQLPKDFIGSPRGDCIEEYVDLANVGSLSGASVLLTTAKYETFYIVGYYYSKPDCVDCRLQGGTNLQPSFMKP